MPRATRPRKSRGSEAESNAAAFADECFGVPGPIRVTVAANCGDADTMASLASVFKDASILRTPAFLAAWTRKNHAKNKGHIAKAVNRWCNDIAYVDELVERENHLFGPQALLGGGGDNNEDGSDSSDSDGPGVEAGSGVSDGSDSGDSASAVSTDYGSGHDSGVDSRVEDDGFGTDGSGDDSEGDGFGDLQDYVDLAPEMPSPITSEALRSLASCLYNHGSLEAPNFQICDETHWYPHYVWIEDSYGHPPVAPRQYVGGGRRPGHEAEEEVTLLSLAKGGDVGAARVLFAVTEGCQGNCNRNCSSCSYCKSLRVDGLLEGQWRPLLIHNHQHGENGQELAPRIFMPSDAVCAQLATATGLPKEHLGVLVKLLVVSAPRARMGSRWGSVEFADTVARFEQWRSEKLGDVDMQYDEVTQNFAERFTWGDSDRYSGDSVLSSYPSMCGVDEVARNNGKKTEGRRASDEKDGGWWSSVALGGGYDDDPRRGYSPRWLSYAVKRLFVKTPLPEMISDKNVNLRDCGITAPKFRRRHAVTLPPASAFASLPDLCEFLSGLFDGPPANFKRRSEFLAWQSELPSGRARHGVWRVVSILECTECYGGWNKKVEDDVDTDDENDFY